MDRTLAHPADGDAVPSPAPGSPRRGRGGGRRLLLPLGAAVVVLAAALAVVDVAAGSTRDEVAAYTPTGAITRIEVDVEAGPVTLTAGDAVGVEVGTRRSRLVRRPTTRVTEDAGILRVTGACPSLALGRCTTPVTVVAPAGLELIVHTTAGRIEASGVEGSLDLRADAGSIDVRDVSGTVRLRTDAGAIGGTVGHGSIDAATDAGSIDLIVTQDAERISAVTSAGSVDLTVPDDVYRVEASTTLGPTEVDVRTTGDALRRIEARSEVGGVRVRPAPAGR